MSKEKSSLFHGAVINILLIEDEEYDVDRVRSTIRPFEDQIRIREVVADGTKAVQLLTERRDAFDVVIMDLQIAGGLMGEPLIRALKKAVPSVQIIVVTKMTVNIGDFDFANRLLKAGAYWYCTKYPADIEGYIYQPTDFIMSIFNAYQKKVLEGEKVRSEKKLLKNVEEMLARVRILGVSEPIQSVREQIKQCASTDATVLISGASGTGKELVATNIHYESARKLENFVPINCGGIPGDLIESELFGYEKGAFTGAHARKPGLFEVANHGTLFLDEIAELPIDAQVKLLRVLQNGEIDKIGRTEKLKVNVRVIAATNKVLEQEVSDKRFREDLFYRLNVVPISIPPLRDRPQDIPVLWEHFMQTMSAEMMKPKPVTEEEAHNVLGQYSWPGNVRELQNAVERMIVLMRGEQLDLPDLPVKVRAMRPVTGNRVLNLPEEGYPLEDLEKEAVVQALERNQWNQTRAAAYLSIPRHTLLYRMEKYEIRKP